MMHPEAVSSLFSNWPTTLKCRKRLIDCIGSENRDSKRKIVFEKDHSVLGETLSAQKCKSNKVSNLSSQEETIEIGPSRILPEFIEASTSLAKNPSQPSSSSRNEEFSSKDYLEGIITSSNKDGGLLQIKQEKGIYNDSSVSPKIGRNTEKSVKISEERGVDNAPLVTTIPIGGKEFIASVLATTSEEVNCQGKEGEENCSSLVSTSKDKVIQLSGDHTYFEFKSPKKKVILKITKNPDKTTDRIKSLEELLDLLKREIYIESDACSMIEAFLDLPNGLIRNKSNNSSEIRPQVNYTKGVEKFASTIYFHAPCVYEFVSKIFLLPEPQLIRNTVKIWNYFPGFTQEALSLLKNGFCNASCATRLCSVMLVNVKIKEQCDFDSNLGRSIGYVDFGGGQDPQDSDEVRTATDALLFVVVGIGSNWKLPFGYFLNNNLSGEFMKTLVTEAIIALEECNLEVRAVVCDGYGSSLSNLFGIRIKVKSYRDIETSFPHPTRSDRKVQLIFDASYGLRLLRNLLADKGSLQSTTYGKIEWRYLSLLLDDSKFLDNPQDFYEFNRQKMKVQAGCHSIGSSIGKIFDLLENQSFEEFQGYSSTANFAADIDRAFDTLNSRNPVAPGERSPMYQYTVEEQKESLTFVARRMMGLELGTGKRVVDEGRRMSVISFASTLRAVCQLASDLVNRNILRYLCTYRLNLQHAEMILSCLKRTGNWNGLPSAAEFRKAYKRLIQRASLIMCNSTTFTNDFEGEDITVSQGNIYPYRNDLKEQEDNVNVCFSISCSSVVDWGSESMSRARFLSRHVARKLACSECIEILLGDEYGSIFKSLDGETHIIPSMYVLKLTRFCEKTWKVQVIQSHSLEIEDFVILVFGEYSQLNEDLGVKMTSINHFTEEPHHVICLTKVIIRTFVYLRKKFLTRFI